jgi:hypothetical protein
MKTKLRGLTMTAMLLSASHMTLADGGDSSIVGDLPGYGEEAYFSEQATYAPAAQIAAADHATATDHVQTVGDIPIVPAAHQYISSDPEAYPEAYPEPYAPVGVNDLRQVGPAFGQSSTAYCDGASCDGSCDSGCGGGGSRFGMRRHFGRIGKMLGLNNNTWATAEFLMWFPQDRDMPALVTTSDPGTLPVLPGQGAPNPDNVQVVFGDDIDGELSGGFRGDVGKFFTDRVGVGGRFWILTDNTDSYFAASDGTDMSIGRPFFNTNTATEDAVLVAFDPAFTGAVAAQSSLEMWAAEGYARFRFGCSKNCQMDLIGGYSHFEIDDTLGISSTSIQTVPATGQTTTLSDLFATKNQFDGGQVGFEMMMRRGRWTARSLTKVHMGNMQQNVRILGSSTVVTAPAAPVNNSGGLLAMGNQGEFDRDVFAFAPEANFKLACQLRHNVSLSVGYSFIFFDNVVLTGDAVDRSIDGSTIATGAFGTRPAFDFDDSSLFVQGLDLGLSIAY